MLYNLYFHRMYKLFFLNKIFQNITKSIVRVYTLPYNGNNIITYRRQNMKNKINQIREKLHQELGSKKKTHENIIKISEELDQLIIQYYKEEETKSEKQES